MIKNDLQQRTLLAPNCTLPSLLNDEGTTHGWPPPHTRCTAEPRPTALCLSWLLLLSSAPTISQAQITLDGSLGPRGALRGPNYTISDSVGQIRGPNLFHSFCQFNLSKGESATFTGPNTITNILSRVTGGSLSS